MLEQFCLLTMVVFIQIYMCDKIQTTLHQMTMIKSEFMENLLEFK